MGVARSSRMEWSSGLQCGVLLWALVLGSASPAPAAECAAPEPPGPASGAAAQLERANALAADGEHAAALALFEASEAAARAEGDAALALLAAASGARSAAQRAPDAAAVGRLDAVLGRVAALGDPALRARLRLHLGRSYALAGEVLRAAEVLSAAAGDAQEVSAWRLHAYAQGYLGELYEAEGQLRDALLLTRRALFSAERAEASDASYRFYAQLGRIRIGLEDEVGALASYRASVATLRRTQELAHAGTEPIYEGLVELLLTRAQASDGPARQRLLAEARDTLEDQNASELRDYFRDPCLDARRRAAPEAIPQTLVVYPLLLADRLVLLASFEGVLESHTVAAPRALLVEEVRAFRRTLETRTTRQYLRHADRLYRWLIGPLEPLLSGGAVETLVFVPRGALNTIPLAALYDRPGRQFLIEKLPLAITPGLTLTEPRSIDRDSVRLLAAGISESVQGFPGLGFVLEEIGAISELFVGRRLVNRDFRVERFRKAVEQTPFGIVHVASHGEFSADASESYVITYDGRISMADLAGLVGKTRFRERGLELLTLSACETAAGDDRAALGLAGVALGAGARSALATLWAVNDRVSAELMTEFYRQLLDPANTRAAALREAQLQVLRQRAYRHPAYWSPFLLVSSWL